jgi:hypothetical protein
MKRQFALLEQAFAMLGARVRLFPVHGITAEGSCTCGRGSCPNPGKHPRTKHGHKDASVDPEQIALWCRSWPNANVGVVTGRGLLVLDEDPRHGGDKSLAELVRRFDPLPVTPTVRTGGGGHHYYFASSDALPSRVGVFPGLDVRDKEAYVVAPPSRHASGEKYEWLPGLSPADAPYAPVPEWLVAQLTNKRKHAPIHRVGEGRRNNHLASVGGHLRRNGAIGEQIHAALLAENAATCTPPLSVAEVHKVAESVSRYPVGGGSVADALKRAGADKLTKESTVSDREPVARALIVEAASLDPVGRALLRDELVQRYAFPAPLADSIVHTTTQNSIKTQGAAMLFDDPPTWASPVDGAALLDEIEAVFRKYLVLPPYASVALTLWVVHTHAFDAAHVSPRVAIMSPEKRCGKSTLLKLLEALVRRALVATNITAATLFRTIEAHQPTLLVDEVDTFLRDRDDVRGVLNAGHDRASARVPRCVGDEHEPRVFHVWTPVAFAGIGKQHDTLMDRSIVVSMKRRAPNESVAPFRRSQREAVRVVAGKAARWANDNVERLRHELGAAPEGLDDRAADNWEALLAIADAAGGPWPKRSRDAARMLSGASRDEASSTRGEQLLADVKSIFDEVGDRAIPARKLLDRLLAMDERPWTEMSRGRALTPRQLGLRLGQFGVKSKTIRDGATIFRGYERAELEDAFARYIPDRSATTVTAAKTLPDFASSQQSQPASVTDSEPPGTSSAFAHVTDVTEPHSDDNDYIAAERAAIQDFGS